MKITSGDKFMFRGCMWDDGWEFDAPIVVYTPAKRIGEGGSICRNSILGVIEDVCIDACVDGEFKSEWSPDDRREFEWRGWSPAGFARRKRAVHVAIEVEFYTDEQGNMQFRTELDDEE